MTFDLGAHAGAIERNGYTIIEDFMDAARLGEVRRVLGFYLGSHAGRNPCRSDTVADRAIIHKPQLED